MELHFLLRLVNNNKKLILITSFLSSLIFGLGSFLIPQNFLAEGTIFAYPVNSSLQKSEVSNEMNYSRNLIALSNSPEFKKILLEQNLVSNNFIPMVGVTGNIKLKEISPNILSLSVSGNSLDQASSTYKKYLIVLNDFSKLLQKGNSSFELSFISENPIVSRPVTSLYLFVLIGFICGFFVSILYAYIKKK